MTIQSLASTGLHGGATATLDQAYEQAETRDLVALVTDAAELVRTRGESAFKEFRVADSRWRHEETYIFVLDPEGNMLVHLDPAMEGRNQLALEDVDGKPIVRGLLGAATALPGKPEGWYHYQWPVPGGFVARWKSSYVRLVEAPSGDGERRWVKADIHRQIALRVGRFKKLGLLPEDRVFLPFGNRLEFFAEMLAIWNLGACAIPIDARLTAFEAENLSRAAGPKLAVVDEATPAGVIAVLNEAGIPAVPTTDTGNLEATACRMLPDQDALMLFTSGSTGDPKGVVHTHRSLRARWTGLRDHLPAAAFARTLCMLPTHFGHGLICNCLFPWLSGNDLYVTPPFRPDLVARLGGVIDEHGITFMSSVPPIWKLALKLAAPPRKGTLRRVHVGSAPLSAAAETSGVPDGSGDVFARAKTELHRAVQDGRIKMRAPPSL